MIPIAAGVRVWIATGHTDMSRGMQGLALRFRRALRRDPHAGDLFMFRGRAVDLIKALWHDGIGLSLYAKRLDRGSSSGRRRRMARCRSERGADELYAGGDRLEKSATDLATAERRLGIKNVLSCREKVNANR